MNKHFFLQSRSRISKVAGFTLIELMITVAIIAILSAIAYPSYQNQVMRTHRNAAKACLSQYVQFMERYYTTRFTYVGAAPTLGCSTEGNLNQRYTLSVGTPTQSLYTVTATPINTQLSRDTRCSTLSIDQSGVRNAGSGSASDIAYCW